MDLSRRQFGALAAGSLAGLMNSGSAEAAAAPSSTAGFRGACDAHVHIIGPRDKYPMVPNRAYTPPTATVAQLRALHRRLGIQRIVLVQPSFYGTDNSCMLDALKELGDSARGVAVIAANTPEAELRDMDAKGVRGIRINLESAGNRDPKAGQALLAAMAKKVAPLNWHIQIYAALPVLSQMTGALADSPVPVVLDHFGGLVLDGGPGQRGWQGIVDIARAGKAYVKLSAPYRVSKTKDYADLNTWAQTIIYARRDHMLWASDWPHTQTIPGKSLEEVTPFNKIDAAASLRQFNSWYPDETTRRMMLVDNPAKLYRFPAAA